MLGATAGGLPLTSLAERKDALLDLVGLLVLVSLLESSLLDLGGRRGRLSSSVRHLQLNTTPPKYNRRCDEKG